MKKKWIFLVPAAIVGSVIFIAIGGEVVMYLWNWLLPKLFGWRQITFWQALALLTLCRILFGGHGFHRSKSRSRMGERWKQMTPEEREKFREGFRSRCGFAEPTSGTRQPAP